MRLFSFVCVFALIICAANAQETVWLKDSVTGCKFAIGDYLGNLAGGYPAHWNGACEGDTANGAGGIKLLIGKMSVDYLDFPGTSGLIMKNGMAELEQSEVLDIAKFGLIECDLHDDITFAKVRIDVAPKLAVWATPIEAHLFELAANYAWQSCPPWPTPAAAERRGLSRYPKSAAVQVYVYQNNQLAISSGYITTKISCGEQCIPGSWNTKNLYQTENHARRRIRDEIETSIQLATAQEQNAVQQQRALESRRNFDNFATQAGVSLWPSSKDLHANPFQFKGRIVGIYASFESMLSESEALILSDGPFYLSHVPATKFQNAGGEVVIAAKVIGIQRLQIQGTTAQIPHLEYVNAHICTNLHCSDLFAWANK